MKRFNVFIAAVAVLIGSLYFGRPVHAGGILASFYGLVQSSGTAQTRRQTLNFTGAGVTVADNPGSLRTDVTISGGGAAGPTGPTGATGATGAGYDTIQAGGSPLPQQTTLNFPSNMTCVDDPGNSRTNCTPSGGGGGVTISGLRFTPDAGANYYGPIFNLIEPPAVGSFTWINQGPATAVKTNGTIALQTSTSPTTNLRLLVESMPTRPFSFRVAFQPNGFNDQSEQGGMVLRDSVSGKVAFFAVLCCVNDVARYLIQLYNSETSYSSFEVFGSIGRPAPGGGVVWLRWDVEAGSGNRIPMLSANGVDWITPNGTIPAWNSFLTPDQIGIGVESNGNGGTSSPASITVLSYSR